MLVYRTWRTIKTNILGEPVSGKAYRILLLFGIVPLFIWVDGKE